MNIFIGSLPFSIKESELREVFEEYGAVESAKIITDKFTGRSKGFGFVEMNNDEEAKRAIEELNGAEVENRTIVVNEARERTENTGSFGGNNNRRRNNTRGRSY
ncbi:MAG: RNA-binding protein [Bacteroidales bacterium]|jgi:RNA recognition motif-containing protein|nr:RNA-binding protein [Bacteroidales bacterium]MDD2687461.1 RNA-binding protein [Bacteroidales bacterium]MDD3331112.1 RNA-binding protein [Bacteroidales bacterium]MDD3691936.1 RNA-binding protein [Bacteroidales bacterium]MDD4045214.1 RNA-binding protein [Bacteroidales bacterium]